MSSEAFLTNNRLGLGRKVFLLILICALFLPTAGIFFVPKRVAAIPVVETGPNLIANAATAKNTTVQTVKETIFDAIAFNLARLFINRITEEFVAWIQRGFRGDPAFITDPKTYFDDIGDDITGIFIAAHGVGFLCGEWDFNIRLSLLSAKPYRLKAACTISQVIQSMQNFNEGGWDGFMSITTHPYNNPFGSFMLAQSELAFRIGEKKIAQEKLLDWGTGFLSWTKEGECLTFDLDGACENRAPDRILTPGRTIADHTSWITTSPVRQAELADEIDESIAIVLSAVILQLIDPDRGLAGIETRIFEEAETQYSAAVSGAVTIALAPAIANTNSYISTKGLSLALIPEIYVVFDSLIGVTDGSKTLEEVKATNSCLANSGSQVDNEILIQLGKLAGVNIVESFITNVDLPNSSSILVILNGWQSEVDSNVSATRLTEIEREFRALDLSGAIPSDAQNELQSLENTKQEVQNSLSACQASLSL